MEYVIVIGVAIVVAVVAVTSERRARAKGKRVSGALTGAFGAIDEVFRPATHSANTIQEAEQRMPAPAPLAGGPLPRSRDANPSPVDEEGTAAQASVSLADG